MSNLAIAPNDESQAVNYREKLACNFKQLDDVFDDCMSEAVTFLTENGIDEYLDGATLVCGMGRGFEPVLVYLEEMPAIAHKMGESTLSLVAESAWKMSHSPNSKAIVPFMQSLPEAARRLGATEPFYYYIKLVFDLMERSSTSVHGNQSATYPSTGLPEMLNQSAYLLNQLSLEGLKNWMDYGIRNYTHHPERQKDYFSLQSADSRAILQRERHGTLFADNERQLDLYMRALWDSKEHFVPYSEGFSELRKPMPYFTESGVRLPDVYDDADNINGINRYRALLGHIAAHKRWSTPIVADNYSPFQRVAVEIFEDCRVEYLAMQHYPGLRLSWLALHPMPIEAGCDPEKESCILHRLAMFSYAILAQDHPYQNPDLIEFAQRFNDIMQADESSTAEMAKLAVSFIARTRRQQDLNANVYFADTEVSYRDDNRHLWIFIEESDDEEMFDQEKKQLEDEDTEKLPPRHYPEWDYQTQTYRPDWVSLYEALHPSGDPMLIDALLSKHESTARRLKQILDLLKPQDYVRVRYQEEGSELDLDVAIRSLIDFKAGTTPDPRINMSHKHDGRNIAVMLLLDLSESVSNIPQGCEQTILELSQEAVALLGWAVDKLGDEFAIAGFSSNTRHEVRYQHIKGYSEGWDDNVKGRLAAMEAGYSTRMGAALRHASHYLSKRQADKKLLLVLTDGEPSDIDVKDDKLLIADAKKAVQEAEQKGIYTHCINLDPHADDYVGEIFGNQYLVIDHIERLPEQLPKLFVSLTS
ncbi:VWA domain-containing protein [Candidatus Albibeggiatoa sp. nov. BB20]|uniref:nitric oxide reductase activation protein NorD n=1 Tax=Candidatus Albibeggiatoa sp. nov. BB20 TaxID=3162723 RepID=UPI0033658EB2